MKVTAIIAEYNPFHNGHASQIRTVKETYGADFCVIIMSGNFVQRGAPAIVDKFTRTRWALCSGADIVFELPTRFATAGAEQFAYGACSLLHRLGSVDSLCFGSETTDIGLLERIADLLLDPPDSFHKKIQTLVRTGKSFAAAREEALYLLLARELCNTPFADRNAFHDMISAPNTILGIEYCKALKKLQSPIQPLPVLRLGSSYHAAQLPKEEQSFSSASAIRKHLLSSKNFFQSSSKKLSENSSEDFSKSSFETFSKNSFSGNVSEHSFENFSESSSGSFSKSFFPENSENSSKTLSKNIENIAPFVPEHVLFDLTTATLLNENNFSSCLYYALLGKNTKDLTQYYEVSEEIAQKICNTFPYFTDFSSFTAQLKTKQYTYARLQRSLLHILLSVQKDEPFQESSYLRLLGLKKEASHLLRNIPEQTGLRIITKPANAEKILSEKDFFLYKKEINASQLYGFTACHKAKSTENYRELAMSPVIL